MSNSINKSTYIELIKNDIFWLITNTERSLERDHIIAIIIDSINKNYPNDIIDNDEINNWLKLKNIKYGSTN